MEINSTEALNNSQTERIERETGVRVPSFISQWPAVEKKTAAELARSFNLVDEQWQDQRTLEKAGLLFCRDHNVGVDEAYKNAASWERTRPNVLNLFDRFLNPNWDRNQLAVSEAKRREKRDLDILRLETDLLKKRGIIIPNFSKLIEYCAWIPEITGTNQRRKEWGGKSETADVVYWDLMDHYSQIIKGSRHAFDPLTDFELYLKGKKDICHWDEWDLQNMGKEDITYYSMSMAWGGGARTISGEIDTSERLLTHSTSLNCARSIIESSYLYPRVCLSVGRVVSVRENPEVTFIFDLKDLGKVYSVREYGESSHEKEVRCEEPVHIGFAIGCVPMSEELFPDTYGHYQGTTARGDKVIQRWEKHFLKTGKLWEEEEVARIRATAGKHKEEKESTTYLRYWR